MLWTIVVILLVLWLLGAFVFPIGGGIIHVLLVIALIVVWLGQLPILSQEQPKETSQEHPDAVSDKHTLSRRVLPLADSGLLLEKYYARRSQEKAVALHAKNPPAQFLVCKICVGVP